MSGDQPDRPVEAQAGDSGRLAAIAAASAAFSDAVPDIEALLAIVAEHISRATGDFCSVVLLSPDGKRIEPGAAYHPDPSVLDGAKAFLGCGAHKLVRALGWHRELVRRAARLKIQEQVTFWLGTTSDIRPPERWKAMS